MLALPAALVAGDAPAVAAPVAPMLSDDREKRIDRSRGSFLAFLSSLT
jgi:hypothetical protein